MSQKKNAAWRFFASVKLALIVLIILAVTSIIGTLIKQGQTPAYYVQEYGSGLARFFTALDFTNMYSSWWYIVLLGLFAVNLLVCSIERLPGVWRLMVMDNLAIDPRQLEKMSSTYRDKTASTSVAAAERLQQIMARAGWKNPRRLDQDGRILLFAQKGAWTRLGVYVVHLSILVVLGGVLISDFFGFQAYVFLPEGRSTSSIFLRKSKEPIPLGFELRCDRFEKTFYPNGMVKKYRSDLTVIDPERKTPYQKSVIVNDPLKWRGLTFFQGDSYPLEEYLVQVQNRHTGQEQSFRVPAQRDVAWPEAGVSFRIEELKNDQDGVVQQARIRFTTAAADPTDFWLKNNAAFAIQQAGGEYTFSFRQLNSTLLLVTKDPGVPVVYTGCILMVLGLAVCFLLSHQRIWIQLSEATKQGSQLLVSGISNKNKLAFEKHFQNLTSRIEQDLSTPSGKK